MDFRTLSSLRIVDERKRLGFNQEEAGAACGVRREMWWKYERAKATMGSEVLSQFVLAGADPQYILTGQRQGDGIGEAAVHQAVLDAINLLSLEKKVDADQLAKAVVKLVVRTLPQTAQNIAQAPNALQNDHESAAFERTSSTKLEEE